MIWLYLSINNHRLSENKSRTLKWWQCFQNYYELCCAKYSRNHYSGIGFSARGISPWNDGSDFNFSQIGQSDGKKIIQACLCLAGIYMTAIMMDWWRFERIKCVRYFWWHVCLPLENLCQKIFPLGTYMLFLKCGILSYTRMWVSFHKYSVFIYIYK